MTETAYLAIDLTETNAVRALELARAAFPHHDIELDDMGDNFALDSIGLDWLPDELGDSAFLVDYDHADIVTLCGSCAYWAEYGEAPDGDDDTPSEKLKKLADAALDLMVYTESGICDGCESHHEISYSGGGWHFHR